MSSAVCPILTHFLVILPKPHKLRYHDIMAAHIESFAKTKVHRAGHLIVKGNEAAKAWFALSKSRLVVPDHFDYNGAAGGFQVDLLHGLPRDWGHTDQPVVLPVLNMLNMGMTTAFSRHQEHRLPQPFEDIIARPPLHQLASSLWCISSAPMDLYTSNLLKRSLNSDTFYYR